jgi:transposase
MTRKRRSFTPEFKQEAACLVLDQGYSIAEASRSLDVGENALRRWVMQLSEERGGITPKSKALTLEQQRIQELEARCERLEREKSILKKATVDSTGQCNIMHFGVPRSFHDATSRLKNQRTNAAAETGAVGKVEKRSVAQ